MFIIKSELRPVEPPGLDGLIWPPGLHGPPVSYIVSSNSLKHMSVAYKSIEIK